MELYALIEGVIEPIDLTIRYWRYSNKLKCFFFDRQDILFGCGYMSAMLISMSFLRCPELDTLTH
jgi:hypothetical protein